ncbi:unnamed protein product [Ilex paraguariensis]|uniref:Uncharacterized protein n=1 Tax=Ilex paraguariensis TaxID=185542 RepID=A0ABC8RVI0_9AQUA
MDEGYTKYGIRETESGRWNLISISEGKNPYETVRPWSEKQGGFRACTFVFVLGVLENIGFVANMSVMVLYFKLVMHFDLSTSANTLTNFLGSTFLLTILGGFISDTYLNRLYTCLAFGFLEVVALLMITIQAYSNKLHPDPCGKSTCVKGGEAVMFYTLICLLALGAGGLKGSIAALGADQFDQKDPKGAKGLASYFNYYQMSVTIGFIIGVTGVVWVSMNKDWYWGFFIGLVVAVVGFVVLALGKPFYHFQPLASSPIVKISQVIVVAIRNRNLSLSQNPDELYEIEAKDRDLSEKKSHILTNSATHSSQYNYNEHMIGTITNLLSPPRLLHGPPYRLFENSHSFNPAIPLLFMSILLPIYEFFIVPVARKITGHPSGITQLQRSGVGLVISVVSMGIAEIIEYGIFGIADMFAMVGLMEFFYKDAPSGMRSLTTSFALISLSFGYFLSSAFVNIINAITKQITQSKKGWLHGEDLNHYNLNLFYWFLAVLNLLNFGNYLYLASWYKYKSDTKELQTD